MKRKTTITTFPVGFLQCNCSIVTAAAGQSALVVDPGEEAREILARLKKHEVRVEAIYLTHAHIDHVAAAKELHESTGAPVFMHPADQPLLEHLDEQARWLGIEAPPIPEVQQWIAHGQELALGTQTGRFLHTPGHSPGSTCLHFSSDQLLFSGDTLFAGSIGRTDLWGGSYEVILDSIHAQLLVLPDETLVIPGHGPNTTIGQERRGNPFINTRQIF